MMKKGKALEQLVQKIHQILDSSNYEIEHDVYINDSFGETSNRHQIDVILRPKNKLTGPILISCKDLNKKVGVEHIREWADIVQHTGAASGIIVAPGGFTKRAIDLARKPDRRVSLWVPRPFHAQDFAPDDKSPTGYIAGVTVSANIRTPQIVGPLTIETEPSPSERAATNPVFPKLAEDNRNRWYVFNEDGNVIYNMLDKVNQEREKATEDSMVTILPEEPSYIAVAGSRLRIRLVEFAIRVAHHAFQTKVDLREQAFCYENVITRETRAVPLPPQVLSMLPHQG